MVFIPDGSWIHDPELVEALAELETKPLSATVWRAIGLSQDPLAFSYNGGRWALPSSIASTPVLYTSFQKDGAILEMASWMAQLSPPPSRPIKVHSLAVSVEVVAALSKEELRLLGVDVDSYEERNYAAMDEYPPSKSQEIGAALSFLGIDGLIVPSARFACDNLILFDNQNNRIDIEDRGSEEIDWKSHLPKL